MKKLVTAKNLNRLMALVVVCLMLCAMGTVAFAAAAPPVDDPLAGSAAQDIMTNLIKIIEKLFIYIGIGLAVWGVGQFVLSIKNDDADSKARALKVIIAAICAISIGALTDAIGIENYL